MKINYTDVLVIGGGLTGLRAAIGAKRRGHDAVILSLGSALGAVRVVDLQRSGMRGPIGQKGKARLDVAALRVALDVAGFHGLPVVDARQWLAPADGLARSVACWIAHAP